MVRSRDFSRIELVSILEVIEAAGACSTKAEFRAVLHKTSGLLEADFAVSGACSLSGSNITGIDAAVNASYPDEFVELYLADRYYKADPVLRCLSKFSFTQSWAEIFKKTEDVSSARVLQVVNTAYDFGLRHGIATGVYMPGDERLNVFSFAGPRDMFKGHQKKLLEVLLLHLNKAMATAVKNIGPSARPGRANVRLQRQE